MTTANTDAQLEFLHTPRLTYAIGAAAIALALLSWWSPYPWLKVVPIIAFALGVLNGSRAWNFGGLHRMFGFASGAITVLGSATFGGYLLLNPYKAYSVEATAASFVKAVINEDDAALARLMPSYSGPSGLDVRTSQIGKVLAESTVAVLPNKSKGCAVLSVDEEELYELWMAEIVPTVENRLQAYQIGRVLPMETEEHTGKVKSGVRKPMSASQVMDAFTRQLLGGGCRPN